MPHVTWALLSLGALFAATAVGACAYPRRTTHVVPLPPGAAGQYGRPKGMWKVELMGAELPARKKAGLAWDGDGSGPDPFVRLFVGSRMVWESEVVDDSHHPEWNVALPRNVIFPAGARFHVEVWDYDTPVSADPIGTHTSTGLPPSLLPNAVARLMLGTRGVLSMRLTPPVPHTGVGLEVEVRDNEVIVLAIMPHSPASRSELQVGDHIVAFGTERVSDLAEEVAFGRLSLAVDRGTHVWITRPGESGEKEVVFDKEPMWLVL